MARSGLLAALALSGVSALQVPLRDQLPLQAPELPWSSSSGAGAHASKPLVDTEALQARISTDNLLKRAEDLYGIAKFSEPDYNHPTRVIGSKGHLGTLAYITAALAKLGDYYTFGPQVFPAVSGNVFESRLVLGDSVPKSASPMGLTPPTKHKDPVYGDLVLVSNEGCDASDYPANVTGNIALVKRGTCAFGDKSGLAGKAGAITAVIYDGKEEELHGTLGNPSPHHVATFGLGASEAEPIVDRLKGGEAIDAIAYLDAEVKTIETSNIVAQTIEGDQDNCVMLGGHSDSVAEGPGIVDDGSGSLSLLEIATQLADFKVNNCVRFAWWSGEEEGLLGSDYYVSVLPEEENKKIRLFMDYDMMASPNFAYQVYDANNKDNPVGSQELKQLYLDWYDAHGLNHTLIPFDGRSDYDAFIRNGIPGGGIATGAEGVKTKEEVEQFGGREGEWYDPCYHQLCDDVSNLNLTAWEVNTKLIAHSVATFAVSFEGFPERSDEIDVKAYERKTQYHGHSLVM